ncbi:MAG: hypothetical protein JWN62_2914, partial [Acidimicrobiales bacterium]|nr:hypothetical protein [Acidimicrobiales bacterium]
GVSEARRDRAWFGEDRIANTLNSTLNAAAMIASTLMSQVLEFQRGNARDDIAIVAIAIPGGTPAP